MSKKKAEPTLTLKAPKETTTLIGHEAAEKMMLDAVLSGKLHHAWLITGARGVGKATLAYRFARFLLGGEHEAGLFGAPESLDVGAEHPIVSRIIQGSHPDILTLETRVDEKTGKVAKEIVVDDARNIGKFLSMTPGESTYRVVIIDSIDQMNRSAANSILKILEEPPARAILLLVSHAPGQLLPTIHSRCREIKLLPLSDHAMQQVVQQAGVEISPEEAHKLQLLSEGSPGFALELYAHKGLALYADIIKILSTLPQMDATAAYKLGETLAAKGNEDQWRLSGYLLEWCISRLIREAVGDPLEYELVAGEKATITRLLAARPLEDWLILRDQLLEDIRDTDRIHLDKKQMWVNMVGKMAA